MDNSEEDAGNATIDSRRLEAREKELRTAAEALATVVSIRDAGLAPPVGDEVSDIESMPSPGVPDANTSTEAILDMIDEFVDGPIAARRILCSTSKTEPSFESATSSSKQGTDSTGLVDVKTNCDEIHKSDQPAASVALLEQHTQCIPNSSANGDSTTKTSLQVTFSEGETFKNSLPNVCASSILPAETTISELPSSSANLTVACTVSSENNVRTVKSVSSSDLSEQIISDSVESSSNDSSVSLNKLEVSTHSPLKRRLVRPAPSDRPPDCTVSSTVDSHTVNVDTSELKSGECVTKDVSSSSDAMPVNVKPEEIRHISEVSLCQAETSVSPPKKIKLVRPKPPLNNPSELNIESISSPDNERCQSTSSEKVSLPSSKSNIPGCSSTDLSDHSLINECKDITISADKQPINDAQKVSELEIVPSSLSTQTEQLLDHSVTSVEKPPTCNPNPIEINTPLNIQPSVSNSESTIPESQEKNVTLCPSETVIYTKSSEEAEQLNAANIQDTNDPEVEKKVPPLKLCVQRSSSSTDAESPSENEIYKRVPPLKLTVTAKELPKINEGTDEDERKVPPIILCKSYDSPIRGLVDDEKSIDTEKKVPPLRINTQTSEVLPKSMTNIPQAERKVPPLRISTTTGDLTTMIATDVDHDKKVPPIKISAQPETIVQIDTLKLNTQSPESSLNDTSKSKTICDKHEDIEKKVPPIKLVLAPSSTFETTSDCKSVNQESQSTTASDTQISNTDSKQVPKLTIKIGSQKSEEMKSPVPKLTIKPIKHPSEDETRVDSPVPSITKLNIKPIPKPAEKIYDAHRKSSSSEISESEYSENDEGTSTSDQASASEQGPLKEVPKVTIKLGKICNQIEPTVPKLTIKGIQNCENDIQDSSSNLKLVVTQTDEELSDKVPKLTIKNIAKTDQPLSPKLTIKPIKPPPEISPADSLATTEKENAHVPKITIKPVLKNAPDSPIKTKRSTETVNSDSIPPVTKLNIKPVIKPQDLTETEVTNVKVPVISKINIKPVLRPNTEDEEESDVETIPQISKINIKPLKAPEEVSSMQDDSFDVNSSCSSEKSIPTVTKLNIKPIIKPDDDDKVDSENQSSETGNSSDDNADVPVVTKLNIKPIIKPSAVESTNFKEETLPVVSKLNIKPIIEPTQTAPLSPRILTKLNIKPIVNPNEVEQNTQSNDNEQSVKNPRLLVKINKRIISESNEKCNNIEHKVDHDLSNNVDIIPDPCKNTTVNCVQSSATQNSVKHDTDNPISNIENHDESKCLETITDVTISAVNEDKSQKQNSVQSSDECVESVKELNKFVNSKKLASIAEALSKHENTKANVQNCKLLKQLLEQDSTCDKYSEDNKRFDSKEIKPDLQISVTIEEDTNSGDGSKSPSIVMGENKILLDKGINTNQNIAAKTKEISKDVTKPLEINTERVASPCSGQDSPRIILKINKTDHGSSAKIITEETLETSKNVLQEDVSEKVNETPPLKKTSSTRRKQSLEATPNETLGKRLRSSKVVHNAEQSPVSKRNLNKRQSTETVASQNKQTDMTVLEAKRLRLGQILSNKSLTVTKVSPTSPPNKSIKQDVKNINHTLLNNENCSKNGNSQLHNIFSNLQAKQIQMPLNDINTTKKSPIFTEARKDDPLVSIANSEEVSHTKNSLKDTVIMMNDFSEIRDFSSVSEERPQDPLEVENKITPEASKNIPEKVMETPTPRKRGRPRKLPVSEDAKTVGLPTPALEERPQRSLRLSRERPAILAKPRGRGRGRGAKRATTPPAVTEPIVEKANKFFNQTPEELDPTSSRVKLPRMTEALDKMPSVCSTPLSSRRHSDSMDRLSPGSPDLKSMMDSLPKTNDSLMRSPEGVVEKVRARRGPGSRGGKVRTPKGRGRGRGGGKGAMYMRETMGIYGRVCGPATTTVELFEEETQMMEDSATPSKPSHLLDEDSQSSVMSSTNDSSKPRKSKFADLFDSNKVWTASDVKEYTWPPPESADGESQVMMIQEQVAMFLSVKSFKRRYPELKRRTIVGEEKEYVLSKGLVTEALCDLGITAVEASEVLDIMLSDYPHKYEEYRTYQRDKQIADQAAEENEPKPEVRDRIEMKIEKLPEKQEPKVDPEKTRQDMAAAAIASASEFNSRMNALRRPAVVDLQSLVIHRRRPPVVNPQIKVQPPGGFYPHALLPGQYQHGYKVYTSEQLRYFPLNTVLAAPPAAASPAPSSGSDDDSSGASDDDAPPKRKKLTKTKRTSDDTKKEDDPEEKVDLCRVCNLRVEANRKYTHERFLVCSSCDAKLHPSCVELNADTIRKCREYAWQCVECKCCATCSKKQDDDKMLFCDLCDRGFHIYCVGLADVPNGRWHCVECAVCKSCGAREPSGPPAANPGPSGSTDLQGFSGTPSTPGTSGVAEWHHQTKRGPGGHKVYSHSLCTPCARAYRIGRYCPLCDRSFVGPKGTMQLIICKLCDRQHHKDCVKQTVCNINVLDYTCGECRRSGITSRSAAVRNAPRTIATLFMAKRRFNKYAHRQYMQSRMKKETDADPIDFEDECSEDITEVSDPLEVTAPDSESMPMDYGD